MRPISLLMFFAATLAAQRPTVNVNPAPNPGGRGGQQTTQRAAPTRYECSASGSVVNTTTGAPIARAQLVFNGNAGPVGTASDDQGSWTIANAPCADVIPIVTRLGYVDSSAQSSRSATRLHLATGSPVTGAKLALQPESVISGVVQDEHHDPLPGSAVTVYRVGVAKGVSTLVKSGSATADSAGSFRVAGLRGGRYVVCAESTQWSWPVGGGTPTVFGEQCWPGPMSAGVSAATQVPTGAEWKVALAMTPYQLVHIQGRVTGFSPASPGPNATVLWITKSGVFKGSALVSADATFDIPNVEPGEYTVVIQARLPISAPTQQVAARNLLQNGASAAISGVAAAEVTVGNSGVSGLVLALQPNGSISGRVRYDLTSRQSPPSAVNIALNISPAKVGALPPGEAIWDDQRESFSLPSVAAGSYSLDASTSSPGYYVSAANYGGHDFLGKELQVSGAVGPIEFVVSDGVGGVTATVTGPDDKPAAADVILLPASGHSAIVIPASDDGLASRQNLPTGDYRAWAFDDAAQVPWAEEEWLNRFAGAPRIVSIASGGMSAVSLKLVRTPPE